MTNEKKLQQAFTNWPATNKFWQTSDGECFFTEPRAIKHARKLEDKSVKPYRRDSFKTDLKSEKPASQNKEAEKKQTTKKTK